MRSKRMPPPETGNCPDERVDVGRPDRAVVVQHGVVGRCWYVPLSDSWYSFILSVPTSSRTITRMFGWSAACCLVRHGGRSNPKDTTRERLT